MTSNQKGLVVLVVAALGLWGCAQGPVSYPTAQSERIKTLEGKCGKLEDDYRAVAAARDQARQKLAAAQDEAARLEKELAALTRDRDDLKQSVEARTGERDALQVRCEKMKKGLQDLIGSDDAMANPPARPVTSATSAGPSLGQS